MGMILKGVLALFWLLVIPFAVGILFFHNRQARRAGEYVLTGYTVMLAMMEILALPMIYLNLPLHVLVVVYGVLAVLLACLGAVSFYRRRKSCEMLWTKPDFSWEMAVAVVMVLLQIAVTVVYAHMDADDSFYVGTATTAVETDTIFSISPYTGLPYTVLPKRYVLSPFPVFLAVVSRLCGGLHPAIMAHTVFPAVFILLVYVVLYQYGCRFFGKNVQSKGIYMIFCGVLVWFSGYSIYNSEVFSMIRVWQGKAFLAGVMLPWLFLICQEVLLDRKTSYSWMLLFMGNLACCLLSSMGIMLAPLMMGIFLLMNLIKYRSLRRFVQGVICLLPSVLLGAVYVLVL